MTTHGISDGPVQFTGARGETIGGHFAAPDSNGSFPGVVVIQEVFGVSEFIKETTRRFAAQGYAAIAPDLYSRAQGADLSTLEGARKVIATLPDSQVLPDLQGGSDYLRNLPGFGGRIGVIGFCAGGRYTSIFAARGTGVDAAVSCYGPIMRDTIAGPDMRPVPPYKMVGDIQCPLLGVYAEDDNLPSPEDVAMFDAALTEHGKLHEFHTYPGTGHAFLNRTGANYNEAQATAAWAAVDAWFEQYLK